MAILKIIQLGNPILRQTAKEVIEADREEVDNLALDMLDTLRSTERGVGLAANQVGELMRVIVMYNRYHDAEAVLINPVILTEKGADKMDYESCLSAPGIEARVMRKQKLKVEYLDRSWQPRTDMLKGFPARVVAHEIDHLNGVMFFDRLKGKERTKLAPKLAMLMAANK
jgi:peptide deformylase